MTRFISKNSNLRVILESGFPASPMTGQLARPGVSVKFQNGVVDVQDEEIVKKLMLHPAFNVDFVSAEDTLGRDPFSSSREEMEPVHVLSEIKYGHVEKSVSTPRKMKIPPQLEALVNAKAAEIAKAMIPDILKSLAEAEKKEKVAIVGPTTPILTEEIPREPLEEPVVVPKRRGRPKKEEETIPAETV